MILEKVDFKTKTIDSKGQRWVLHNDKGVNLRGRYNIFVNVYVPIIGTSKITSINKD